MIDGFKNREVASSRCVSSLSLLSEASQRELAETGMLTALEPEYETNRHELFLDYRKVYEVESILGAELKIRSRTSDGIPVTHFLDDDCLTIEVIVFSDTILARYAEAEDTERLWRKILKKQYDADRAGDYVRVKLGKTITLEEAHQRINNIQTTYKQLNKNNTLWNSQQH